MTPLLKRPDAAHEGSGAFNYNDEGIPTRAGVSSKYSNWRLNFDIELKLPPNFSGLNLNPQISSPSFSPDRATKGSRRQHHSFERRLMNNAHVGKKDGNSSIGSYESAEDWVYPSNFTTPAPPATGPEKLPTKRRSTLARIQCKKHCSVTFFRLQEVVRMIPTTGFKPPRKK
ncbi:hypothetical protein PIB30_025242 [Stylosanthes scabra]|uniref:Uncharacterized protein n=1 Tax=Stylosanthes scabra TaxID=79078 RepID=A0ABU6S9G3_9FABA|nr:hypothetical protein [Stylosanthes scabra]